MKAESSIATKHALAYGTYSTIAGLWEKILDVVVRGVVQKEDDLLTFALGRGSYGCFGRYMGRY